MASQREKLWDKRTCGQAALALAVAIGLSVSVCAFKGELATPAPTVHVSVVQSHTAAPTQSCGGK